MIPGSAILKNHKRRVNQPGETWPAKRYVTVRAAPFGAPLHALSFPEGYASDDSCSSFRFSGAFVRSPDVSISPCS